MPARRPSRRKTPPKPRNPAARALADPKFRKRVAAPDKKQRARRERRRLKGVDQEDEAGG